VKTDLLLIPMGARYRGTRDAAVAAEEAGFDGLWTWDHLRDPDGGDRSRVPESWTVLAALAEATHRLALGPLVLNVGSRHPGLLANMAVTLQEVSGGRLLLGLGAGAHRRLPYAVEHEALGIVVAFIYSTDQLVLTAGIVTTLIKGDVFQWGSIRAGALLAAAPPVVVYAFLMDYYIAGLTAGATKG
jgi:hypothetical protein